MRDAKIIGTGIYVPERVVTNAELSRNLGEDIDEFVSTIVGIKERHIAAEDESSADLAAAAAQRALFEAGIVAADLDLILVATDTPGIYFAGYVGRCAATHRRGECRNIRHQLRVCRIRDNARRGI
jgi:3-oxoacyl-[acyl-carrier-protein] synthase-3